MSDFVLSQDDPEKFLIRTISGYHLAAKAYFVTTINTSDAVCMKKAQLEIRTGEFDWDKLLQKFQKYSAKKTRGGYRLGCNGDSNCLECVLKNKIKTDMSPCADPHGNHVILHVFTLMTVHVLTHTDVHVTDRVFLRVTSHVFKNVRNKPALITSKESMTFQENVLLEFLERGSVLFYQCSLTLLFCQDVVIIACSVP